MKDNDFFNGLLAGVLGMLLVILLATTLNKPSDDKLDECVQEARAWYNATTALSDAIVMAALKGFPAEKVDTGVATAFAVQGHELDCIRPKFPTG
jgi:hypothetical protein